MPSWTDERPGEGSTGIIDFIDGDKMVGKIWWHQKDGPFFCFAVHPAQPTMLRRLGALPGPIDAAKKIVEEIVAGGGPDDIHERAGRAM